MGACAAIIRNSPGTANKELITRDLGVLAEKLGADTQALDRVEAAANLFEGDAGIDRGTAELPPKVKLRTERQ